MPEQDANIHFLIEDVSDLSISELAGALTSIAKQLEQWPDEVFIRRGMRVDGIVDIDTQRRSSVRIHFHTRQAATN